MAHLIFRKHFSPFHFYIDRSRKVALILNPKVGSTFLRKTLSEAHKIFLDDEDPSQGRYAYINMARNMPLASISDYLHFFRFQQNYKVYAIVRNPIDRAVSAWRDKFFDGHHNGYPRSMRQGELAKARHFAKKNKLRGAEEGDLFPLASFVNYVESEIDGKRNHHWDLQCKVLITDRVNYTQFFNIESGMVDLLSAVFDQNIIPLSWIEEKAARTMNASSKSSVLLEPDLLDRLISIYREDFHAFGYKEHDVRLKYLKP